MQTADFARSRPVRRRSVFSFSERTSARGVNVIALLLLVAFALAWGTPPHATAQPPVSSIPAKRNGEVIFVVYNLWNYLAMDRRIDGETVEDAPKPEEQIEALIDAIVSAQPDVLGVCELGDETFLDDLKSRLKARGVDLPHSEMVLAAYDQQRNLALLSRFPIVARNSRDDLVYRIDDTVLPHQRGILDVTLALSPEYRLRCIGLHLKSKREVSEADQAEMRRHEAELAREHIDAIFTEQPGVNLLVYGDLNDTRNEPPVRALQGRFGSDTWLADLKLEDSMGFLWTHHWSWANIYARIDFALVSSGLSPEIDRDRSYILHPANWELASDHRPLVISLEPVDQ